MKKLLLTSAALVALAASPNLHAQLIANGNFEANPVGTTAGSPPNIADSTTFTDFRFFNVNSSQVAFGATISGNGTGGSTQARQLDVNNSGAAIGSYGFDDNNNKVSATTGNSYTVTFQALDTQVAVNAAAGTAYTPNQTISLNIGEYDGATYNNVGVIDTTAILTGSYLTYSFTYTPTGIGTTDLDLMFAPDSGLAQSGEVDIDNITFGPTTVPEPSTWAMFLSSGFALLGFSFWRRTQNV